MQFAKYRKIAAVFIFLVLLLGVAQTALAVSWIPLVPCGREGLPDCNECELLHLLKNLIDAVIEGVVPIGGALLFTWAGLLYILAGANPGNLTQAKSIFTNTLYSIAVIGLAYLITNTIIVNLAPDYSGNWFTYQCTPGAGSSVLNPGGPPPPASGPPPPAGGPPPPAGQPGGGLSEADARAKLAAAGVQVNAQPPQTTLAGMKQSTVDEIIKFKKDCGCSVTVTGGTEHGACGGGSQSHCNGYKFDMSPTSAVSDYITSHYTRTGTRSDGAPLYKAPDGSEYADERNIPGVVPHWDVTASGG